MSKAKLNWKVSVVPLTELEKTLNAYEEDEFEIERFEKNDEVYNDVFAGTTWIVVGWKQIAE